MDDELRERLAAIIYLALWRHGVTGAVVIAESIMRELEAELAKRAQDASGGKDGSDQ